MAKVGIITDTVACLPEEKVKEYNIGIVPYTLTINGKSYLDQVDIHPDDFWRMFKDIKEFSTGAPAQGVFLNAYKEMSKRTDNIVCTFVSKALSAMQESAAQAREIFVKDNPEVKIEIVDSRKACGAQGFIALEMARAAQAVKSLAEIVKIGKGIAVHAKFLLGMETLKYLIKGGRAPKAAYVGEWLGIKPIAGMLNNTGVMENIGRARGMRACMQKMVELISEHSGKNKPLHINVHYTNNIEEGKGLLKILTAGYSCNEQYLTPFTPVMCGHTGPVVAVSFYSNGNSIGR
jgi:DegV family protein with EDD domain